MKITIYGWSTKAHLVLQPDFARPLLERRHDAPRPDGIHAGQPSVTIFRN